MATSLVVYYSRKGENFTPGGIQMLEKGNTAYAAEFIRDAVMGDLFEVDTENPMRTITAAAVKKLRKKPPQMPGLKSKDL